MELNQQQVRVLMEQSDEAYLVRVAKAQREAIADGRMEEFQLNTGQRVVVHAKRFCVPLMNCPVHYRMDGSYLNLPMIWRDDVRLFERLCAHGVGHPDPNQFAFWHSINQDFKKSHGCDGCCSDWTG